MEDNAGIISRTRFKIETTLKERKAFNEKSAACLDEVKIDFRGVLDLMEKKGLIVRTFEGKIFITQKGQQDHLKAFL